MAKAKKQEIDEVELEAVAAEVNAVNEVPAPEPEESTEPAEETTTEEQPEKATAKAGKRSEKALKEAEEKEAKEERKVKKAEAEGESKPKPTAKPTRSRLERRGKNFRKSAEQIEKGKVYKLAEALALAVKTSPVKFDASVELHINLNVDPRHADQNIRDNLVLPAGTGKSVRVAVFDDGKADGADIAGTETVLKALEKGQINFDVLIATPAQMPKLGKYARLLGPRGLMPNPKSGTVTTDITKAVAEAKAGRVEYRVDSTGIVHLAIGKVSFGAQKLQDNARAVFASVKGAKPASIKGTYVKAIHATTTMGPSIAIDVSEL